MHYLDHKLGDSHDVEDLLNVVEGGGRRTKIAHQIQILSLDVTYNTVSWLTQ